MNGVTFLAEVEFEQTSHLGLIFDDQYIGHPFTPTLRGFRSVARLLEGKS
jgi:hypothetical protein